MSRSMPYRPFNRRRATMRYFPERPASRGLFIAAMTLFAIFIAVVLWCVVVPVQVVL